MLKKINDKKIFEYIFKNLREEDLIELKEFHGQDWQEKVLKTLENTEVTVMFVKNKFNRQIPIAMGGFEPYIQTDENIAAVWLLSTKFVNNYKYLFWKELKNYFNKEKSKYTILFNFIYKSNFQAKRWLKLLGFKFDNPKPDNIDVPENFEFFYSVINGKEK